MTPLAFDIAVGSIIILSTLVAYFRGIVTEFFMMAGLALAVFLSYSGGHMLVPDIGKWLGVLPNPADEKPIVLGILKPTMATNLASYGGIFLLIFILMVTIRVMISHWVNASGLGVADRLMGALFGFLRGFLLVFLVYTSFLLLLYQGDREKLPEWAKGSYSASVFDHTIVWSNTHIDLDKKIDDLARELDKIDHGKFGKKTDEAAKELKEEVKKEETAVQKSAPETPPAAVPTVPVSAEPAPPPPAATPAAAAPPAPPAAAPPPPPSGMPQPAPPTPANPDPGTPTPAP